MNLGDKISMLEAQIEILRHALAEIGTGEVLSNDHCCYGCCDEIAAFARDAL